MLYYLLFFVSFLSLLYELLLSTQWSYLLGNSITVFSLTIWFFLLWLWVGSYFSRSIKEIKRWFFLIEIALWYLGWLSVFLIKRWYLSFWSMETLYWAFFILLVLLIGSLTGCESPLIASMIAEKKEEVESHKVFRDVFGTVLSVDYIGSLIATLFFPFFLLPFVWLEKTVLLAGVINILIAWAFANKFLWRREMAFRFVSLVWYLLLAVSQFLRFDDFRESGYFSAPVIYTDQSQYQKITLTKDAERIRLYLDGHIQFDSRDHHRYHQSLVDVMQKMKEERADILILWWWDGLLADAVRIKMEERGTAFSLDLVELDSSVVDLAKTHDELTKINHDVFYDERVNTFIDDAFSYLRESYKKGKKYDMIFADFPDPRTTELAKLYTEEFYRFVKGVLGDEWAFVTHASNAYITQEVFSCIYQTIEAIWSETQYSVIPYHSYIPSRWDWWFVSVYPKDDLALSLTYGSTKFDTDYDLSSLCKNSMDYSALPSLYRKSRK